MEVVKQFEPHVPTVGRMVVSRVQMLDSPDDMRALGTKGKNTNDAVILFLFLNGYAQLSRKPVRSLDSVHV